MSSLYQITDDLKALDSLLVEAGGDITEGTDGAALDKWLADYQWQLAEKVDNYAGLVRCWESDIKACAEERKRLQERERIIKNRIDRLKTMAKFAMDKLGTRKLDGKLFNISIAKNGGFLPMELTVPTDKVPPKFIEITCAPNMDAIRSALEACDPDAEKIAKFGERGESVRIK